MQMEESSMDCEAEGSSEVQMEVREEAGAVAEEVPEEDMEVPEEAGAAAKKVPKEEAAAVETETAATLGDSSAHLRTNICRYPRGYVCIIMYAHKMRCVCGPLLCGWSIQTSQSVALFGRHGLLCKSHRITDQRPMFSSCDMLVLRDVLRRSVSNRRCMHIRICKSGVS
jgi:hypothetical protein